MKQRQRYGELGEEEGDLALADLEGAPDTEHVNKVERALAREAQEQRVAETFGRITSGPARSEEQLTLDRFVKMLNSCSC